MRVLVTLPLLALLCPGAPGGALVPAPSPRAAALPPAQTEPNTAAVLVSLTKRIVKAAAKVGIDEAGSRILGPTVWKYAKAMIEPVYGELERRFPALRSSDTPQAEAAADKATATLDSDPALQRQLLDLFLHLEEGQAQILLHLCQLEDRLERLGTQVDENKELTQEVLRRLPAEPRPRRSPEEAEPSVEPEVELTEDELVTPGNTSPRGLRLYVGDNEYVVGEAGRVFQAILGQPFLEVGVLGPSPDQRFQWQMRIVLLFLQVDYFLREDGTVWADLIGSGTLFLVGSWMR